MLDDKLPGGADHYVGVAAALVGANYYIAWNNIRKLGVFDSAFVEFLEGGFSLPRVSPMAPDVSGKPEIARSSGKDDGRVVVGRRDNGLPYFGFLFYLLGKFDAGLIPLIPLTSRGEGELPNVQDGSEHVQTNENTNGDASAEAEAGMVQNFQRGEADQRQDEHEEVHKEFEVVPRPGSKEVEVSHNKDYQTTDC